MASVTVTKSRLALPWFGAVVLIIEHATANQNNTIVLSSIDGGQGISFVYGVLGFNASGVLIAIATQPSVTTNGTTVTVGDTAETTLIVFGR